MTATASALKVNATTPSVTDLAPAFRRAIEIERQEVERVPAEGLDVFVESAILEALSAPVAILARKIVDVGPACADEFETWRMALEVVGED